jgi:hypothetical protein
LRFLLVARFLSVRLFPLDIFLDILMCLRLRWDFAIIYNINNKYSRLLNNYLMILQYCYA